MRKPHLLALLTVLIAGAMGTSTVPAFAQGGAPPPGSTTTTVTTVTTTYYVPTPAPPSVLAVGPAFGAPAIVTPPVFVCPFSPVRCGTARITLR